MSEELSLPRILPIGMILFETLFLLIAIAIEGSILNKWLKFDKKTSIFYAISMNVFSSVIGWNIFFIIEPILPAQTKSELIGYVFFNTLKNTGAQSYIILTCFLIFFGTFLVKFLLLKILIISLDEIGKKDEEETQIPQKQKKIISQKIKLQNTTLVTSTLIANSMSYSAITLILLIRNWSIRFN